MGRTTINCDTETKAWFDELRPDAAASEDEFLTALLRHYDDTTEQDSLFAEEINVVDVDAIREELNTDAPDFDDVKAATKAALREELPEGALR
jgi:uncharacterized protein YhdP